MARNVTQSQAREAEARARSETANTQKTEFVRYITHELRSPLNAIIGFANRLSQAHVQRSAARPSAGKAVAGEQIKYIKDAAEHLLSLVNDLLDLGKIEAGQYSLNETEIGLDEIIDRSVRILGDVAAARSITLRAHYLDEPPLVLADERALYQVLMNLVTNAVRYGRDGGTVEIRTEARPDGIVEIRVVDDGPGIEADDIERVMMPFERAQSTSGCVQGTGLGLPIVKRLVELHGGRFELSSAVGVGTVAAIELPACRNRLLAREQAARVAA